MEKNKIKKKKKEKKDWLLAQVGMVFLGRLSSSVESSERMSVIS